MDTEGEVNHVIVITPLLVAVLLIILVRRHLRQPSYNHIPTVGGPSRFPFSYIGAFKFFFNAPKQLQDGFKRGHAVFKVADFACGWNVVVTEPQMIEELRSAPRDQISSSDTHDCAGLPTDHTLSSVLSVKLTRNLPVVISEMRDEAVEALSDVISRASSETLHDEDGGTSGWTGLLAADALTEVVSRVCNRVIVGPQLCRSPELTSLNKEYIRYKWIRSAMLAVFPISMCRVLPKMFSGVSWRSWRLRRALRTIIKDRRRLEKHPQDIDTQHDLLSFLLSQPSTNPHEIPNTLITLNLQAIPSCALNLTNALYRLAACDETTAQTLRGDIKAALRSEGGHWTTRALARMVKVDSFMKETMRLGGLDALTTRRLAVVPYTFSDGTSIPQGTHLSTGCTPTHLDASVYTSPGTFDGFRFSGEPPGPRYDLTTAAPEFVAWGLGRGACPGRFFAGAVMKLVLAVVVLLYDVRREDRDGDGVVQTRWVGARGIPNLKGRVVLRKR